MAKARRVIAIPPSVNTRSPEDILRLAVDSLPNHAFLTLDLAGVITSWNGGAERLLGHSRSFAIARHISALMSSTDGPAIGQLDLELAARDSLSRRQVLIHADGTPRDAHLTLVALENQHGPVGYAVLAHPIQAPLPSTADAQLQLSESATLLAAETAERTQAEASRGRLLRRLVVAQEEERRRIARDLHDDLGQRLTALRLMLEGMAKAPPASSHLSASLAAALQVLVEIDQSLDFIAWELRPAALDELGLVKVLDTYVAAWSRHAGIPAAFHARPGQLDRFAPELEASVYRIAQEALNNVAKHARAHSVNVLLELRGKNVALVVEDDGVGFHPTAPGETMIGLMGMRERALAVGGTLEIEPTPHGGTTVLACIPTSCRADTSHESPVLGHHADADERRHGGGAAVIDPQGSALAAIRARLQELQQAVGARDEFIATVAHELRNPIAPLTFQVRLALNKMEQIAAAGGAVSVDWIQSQFRGIERRLHRLLETLDRLLDVSRLSTGRIDLQADEVNLAELVREVLTSLDAELAVARCKLTLSEHGDTTGSWDRLRLEQICRNLLSNAIRFGAGAPIEISVSADRDFVVLRIRDHGIGIAPEQQARLFERFERGIEQRSGGFGIGLWVVRNVCLAMGGEVSVESELGDGACFTVMLPRRPSREPAVAGLE